MGSIIKKRCLSCGKEWDHFEGVGFQSAYYYCDKCGKEKVMIFLIIQNWKKQLVVVNVVVHLDCTQT
jgi:hypothetical protein